MQNAALVLRFLTSQTFDKVTNCTARGNLYFPPNNYF